jgi:hypothetical protein
LAVEQQIYYCFVKADVSNAIALHFYKWSCVAISDQLLFEIWYLVCELACSDFLAMYREDIPQVIFSSDKPVDRVELVRKALKAKRLIGPEPRLVKTLSAIAVLFIAHHELGHIVNGHLGAGLVTEVLGETEIGLNLEILTTLRTLEYDADAMATQLTLEYCLRVVGNAGDSTEYFKDVNSTVHTVFAAIYLVMCVLEAAQATSLPDYNYTSHPPALFRYFSTFSVASNVITRMTRSPASFKGRVGNGLSMPRELISNSQARVVRAVELAMTDRVGLSSDPDLVQRAIDAGKVNDAQVLRRWSEIRPKLEKSKLGKHKLAPVQYGPDGKRLPHGPYDWS